MSKRRGPIAEWLRRRRRRWKNRPGWWPWLMAAPLRTVLFVLRRLPEGFALGLFERIGRLAWYLARRREVGREHVRMAMPTVSQHERDRILRTSCGQMARGMAESILLSHRVRKESALDRIEFEPGARELLEELRAGGGAVFVQGHFGAMEVMDGVLGLTGHFPCTPMRYPNNYYLGQELLKARDGWNVELIPRQGALRRMLRWLEEGRSVVLACDQNAHHAPIFVPWFGKLAASDRAAAYLALRLGKPLVVSWAVRRPDGRSWKFGCERVRTAAPPAEIEDETLIEWTARVHATLERRILQSPEQYLWIHNRYRTRPPREHEIPAEPLPASTPVA